MCLKTPSVQNEAQSRSLKYRVLSSRKTPQYPNFISETPVQDNPVLSAPCKFSPVPLRLNPAQTIMFKTEMLPARPVLYCGRIVPPFPVRSISIPSRKIPYFLTPCFLRPVNSRPVQSRDFSFPSKLSCSTPWWFYTIHPHPVATPTPIHVA